MIEAVQTLEGEVVTTNQIDGELNKAIEYIEPTTQIKTITPTKQEQIVEPDEDVFALSKVIVEPIGDEYIIPAGTIEIAENGLYDVKNKEYANVSFNEWAKYGYSSNPGFIERMKARCDEIQNNYDTSTTSWNNKFGNETYFFIMPYVDSSNVTSMYRAFYGASALQSVALFDTSNVTSCSNMFNGCSVLQDVPNFNLVNCTSYEAMFSNCSSLKNAPQLTLRVGGANTFRQMFYQCRNLVNVPYLNISLVEGGGSSATNLQDMFRGCPNLSDESINTILLMCSENTKYKGTRSLYHMGFRSTEITAERIQALSNYQAFVNAGWSIGY